MAFILVSNIHQDRYIALSITKGSSVARIYSCLKDKYGDDISIKVIACSLENFNDMYGDNATLYKMEDEFISAADRLMLRK
jgi:hypothetical protein